MTTGAKKRTCVVFMCPRICTIVRMYFEVPGMRVEGRHCPNASAEISRLRGIWVMPVQKKRHIYMYVHSPQYCAALLTKVPYRSRSAGGGSLECRLYIVRSYYNKLLKTFSSHRQLSVRACAVSCIRWQVRAAKTFHFQKTFNAKKYERVVK